ncbi:hypothetical protein KQI77_01395 [Clostridium sp. MSJ-8]|uniref:hypothetical protein n=1 Tax=Clostridium sp. MSJ-8 TaxID=2841510 RepID=UPI001C0F1026|nr:hypothetical protein [Clostridium sp. MSJ-8]MBU5486816.1 hypothetical protein [Clostridium sp. MSJ-8]
MSRKCERCNWEVTIKYLAKQKSYDEIRCYNCGRILEVIPISKLMTIIYFFIGFLIILSLPIGKLLIIVIEILWIIISYNYLPLIMYMYRNKQDEDI